MLTCHGQNRTSQSRSRSARPSAPSTTSIPIHSRSPSPPQSRSPPASKPQSRSPSPTHPASPTPRPLTEEEAEAGDRIATFYRRVKSLRSIQAIHTKYDTLQSSFVPPPKLDYEVAPEQIVSIPTADFSSPSDDDELSSPPLAYNATNTRLHAYVESLVRLLNDLDAVQSWGDRKVRERRREVVRIVEGEATRVDRWWKGLWNARKAAQENTEADVRTMGKSTEHPTEDVVEETDAVLPTPHSPQSIPNAAHLGSEEITLDDSEESKSTSSKSPSNEQTTSLPLPISNSETPMDVDRTSEVVLDSKGLPNGEGDGYVFVGGSSLAEQSDESIVDYL